VAAGAALRRLLFLPSETTHGARLARHRSGLIRVNVRPARAR